MNIGTLVAATALELTLVLGAAFPADALTTSEQAVVLFSKSCMAFAGQKDDLREWASGQKLTPASPEFTARFMGKIPGTAFAIATSSGNFVIGSQDDGGCTLYAQHADAKELTAKLEELFSGAKFVFKIISEHDSAQTPPIHQKAYEISGKLRKWRVLISTAPPGYAMEGIVTAYNLSSDLPDPQTSK